MITHKTLGSNGRLGNQLFQIAATIGLAEQYVTNCSILNWGYGKYFEGWGEHELPIPEEYSKHCIRVNERFYHYDKNLLSSVSLDYSYIDIKGYFQSEKYFKYNSNYIKGILEFKQEFIEQCTRIYRENEVFDKRVIAISVRRGDYVNNPNYYNLNMAWYVNALIDNFPNYQDCNILVFSDDIPYCRVHFGCLDNVFFSENNSDIEDICLMSQCDDFIVANSTFAWWGAWLGEKSNSKIIHCGKLFKGELEEQNDSKDFYPERWIKYDAIEHEKLDLKDTTFIIPVKYDHKDRYENLELTVQLLHKELLTNILILDNVENNTITSKFSSIAHDHSIVDIGLYNDNNFHRTAMLNRMTKECKTPYVFNWDADVFITPLQLYLTIQELRKGADMCYPYKWAFARIPRKTWYDKIKYAQDIGVVGDTMFNGMFVSDVISLGGAVAFNKESYLSIGGENEYFISFGAEDVERFDRAKLMRLQISRIEGVLYHLNHWVGDDSTTNNPYFLQNKEEHYKVSNMSSDELKSYINTWSWKV